MAARLPRRRRVRGRVAEQVLPATALLLFPPPTLGSYSAAREDARHAAVSVGTFPALPSGDPVDLSVAAFTSCAVYDSGRSLGAVRSG
ncbi:MULTISPECIES: hypothetical protein [unclassified Streptomyces]|uniref:hypothetical protein n=1 Tax=unclassified Streptomyces TaxID=2593676 RepID=UPI0035DEDF4F